MASPVALYSRHANLSITYDLRFDLSPDLRTLTVMELEVCTIKQAPGKEGKGNVTNTLDECADETDPGKTLKPTASKIVCKWCIPAAAFGPDAFFDMLRPPPGDPKKPGRTIQIRNVQYGLRFTRFDGRANYLGSRVLGTSPGFVRFVFTRPEQRWRIAAYETDLWRGPDAILSQPVSSPHL